MMKSRDFYSSLNEVQLNVKEIKSLQVELIKKILVIKNKNILIKTNENKKYINHQFLESKRPELIDDTDLTIVDIAKYDHDNKVKNLNLRRNEDIQFNKKINIHDGVQIKKDSITSEPNFKENNSINEDTNDNSKSKNKKLSLFLFFLIWEAFAFLCIFMFML